MISKGLLGSPRASKGFQGSPRVSQGHLGSPMLSYAFKSLVEFPRSTIGGLIFFNEKFKPLKEFKKNCNQLGSDGPFNYATKTTFEIRYVKIG